MIHPRQGNKLLMPIGWQEDLDNNICPVCKEINPRQYRCCSPKCTKLFWEKAYWSMDLPVKCFERDNHTCIKCGATQNPFFAWIERRDKWNKKNAPYGVKIYENETGDKQPEIINLEADHIKPIALGGDEYDLNNYQTLCDKCHRKKTSSEAKLFAEARKTNSKGEKI